MEAKTLEWCSDMEYAGLTNDGLQKFQSIYGQKTLGAKILQKTTLSSGRYKLTIRFTVINYDHIDAIFENHPIGDELTLVEGWSEGDQTNSGPIKTIIGAKSLAAHLLNSFTMFMTALLIVHFS